MTATVVGSPVPSGRTTKSTDTAVAGARLRRSRVSPLNVAVGRASVDTYFDRVSEIAAHRGSTGIAATGLGPLEHAALIIERPTPPNFHLSVLIF
jgi:hypothetical protein